MYKPPWYSYYCVTNQHGNISVVRNTVNRRHHTWKTFQVYWSLNQFHWKSKLQSKGSRFSERLNHIFYVYILGILPFFIRYDRYHWLILIGNPREVGIKRNIKIGIIVYQIHIFGLLPNHIILILGINPKDTIIKTSLQLKSNKIVGCQQYNLCWHINRHWREINNAHNQNVIPVISCLSLFWGP